MEQMRIGSLLLETVAARHWLVFIVTAGALVLTFLADKLLEMRAGMFDQAR